MAERATHAETAQMLVAAIGRGRLSEYFDQRLAAGRDVAARPSLLAAAAALRGADALPQLIAAGRDNEEDVATRVAVVQAVTGLDSVRAGHSDAIDLLSELLSSPEAPIRSEAAAALADLRQWDYAPALAELLESRRLTPDAEQRVREFVLEASPSLLEDKPMPALPHDFVRVRELEAVEAALAHSRVVSIVGEAGIGKTTVALLCMRRAPHEVKLRVAGGWGQSLREVAVAHLRRELADSRPFPPEREASVDVLATLLAGRSALIVVDEIEQYEPSEVRSFAEGLVRHAGVDLLLVGRLGALVGPPDAPVIHLGPLSGAEARRLVRARLGEGADEVPDEVLAGVLERSGGSPLFIAELVRFVRDASAEQALPAGIREVIERRLAPLSDVAARALEVLAQFEPVVDLRSAEAEQLLERETLGETRMALDELKRAGLIHERSDGQISLAHLLIREVVRERTDLRTRNRLSRSISLSDDAASGPQITPYP